MRIVTKFLATGSVVNVKKEERNDAATTVALDSVVEHPKLSLRERSRNFNISKSKLQRIYKSNKIKAFKPKFVHTTEEGDEGRRLLFCLTIASGRNVFKTEIFIKTLYFQAKQLLLQMALFPLKIVATGPQKIQLSDAVSYRFGIIGPFFIEGRLNQNVYVQLLERFREEYLHDLPLTERSNIFPARRMLCTFDSTRS